MNYIDLIRSFWRSHEENSFSTTEIALYFHLIEVCNICGWKNPFKRNNSKIMGDLGIKDRRTLDNARNKLKQSGLIDFSKVSTNPNVTYTITYAKNAQVNVQAYVQVSAQVDAQVNVQADDTKYKLNKDETKPNNTSSEEDCQPPLEREKIDYKKVVNLYNSICKSFPEVKKISQSRKDKIKTRFLEFGEDPYFLVEAIFLKMESTPFLKGDNKNNWKATFDWIFENDKNWIKLIEGNYDTSTTNSLKTGSGNRNNTTGINAKDRRTDLEDLRGLCNTVLQQPLP